jgi:hypothetical protein
MYKLRLQRYDKNHEFCAKPSHKDTIKTIFCIINPLLPQKIPIFALHQRKLAIFYKK